MTAHPPPYTPYEVVGGIVRPHAAPLIVSLTVCARSPKEAVRIAVARPGARLREPVVVLATGSTCDAHGGVHEARLTIRQRRA